MTDSILARCILLGTLFVGAIGCSKEEESKPVGVDVLFVIDNSGSMFPEQPQFTEAFEALAGRWL